MKPHVKKLLFARIYLYICAFVMWMPMLFGNIDKILYPDGAISSIIGCIVAPGVYFICFMALTGGVFTWFVTAVFFAILPIGLIFNMYVFIVNPSGKKTRLQMLFGFKDWVVDNFDGHATLLYIELLLSLSTYYTFLYCHRPDYFGN